MAGKKVTVRALKVLNRPNKKSVKVGKTTELDESVANKLKAAGAVEFVEENKTVKVKSAGDK